MQRDLVDVGHVHDLSFLVERYLRVHDLLDRCALLGGEGLAIALETAGHELGNHGGADEVGIGFSGCRAVLVARDAGLADAQQAGEGMLGEAVALANILDFLGHVLFAHSNPIY